MQVPDAVPAQFVAGETVDFRLSYDDFPANDGWALKFSIAGRSPSASFDGTADGAGFLFSLPAAETAKLTKSGMHQWDAMATKGAVVKRAARGSLFVDSGASTALGGELESKNETILRLLETRLEGRITEDMDAYAVDGVQVSRIPFKELRQCIADYRSLVASERRGGASKPPLHYVFTRPGAY